MNIQKQQICKYCNQYIEHESTKNLNKTILNKIKQNESIIDFNQEICHQCLKQKVDQYINEYITYLMENPSQRFNKNIIQEEELKQFGWKKFFSQYYSSDDIILIRKSEEFLMDVYETYENYVHVLFSLYDVNEYDFIFEIWLKPNQILENITIDEDEINEKMNDLNNRYRFIKNTIYRYSGIKIELDDDIQNKIIPYVLKTNLTENAWIKSWDYDILDPTLFNAINDFYDDRNLDVILYEMILNDIELMIDEEFFEKLKQMK